MRQVIQQIIVKMKRQRHRNRRIRSWTMLLFRGKSICCDKHSSSITQPPHMSLSHVNFPLMCWEIHSQCLSAWQACHCKDALFLFTMAVRFKPIERIFTQAKPLTFPPNYTIQAWEMPEWKKTTPNCWDYWATSDVLFLCSVIFLGVWNVVAVENGRFFLFFQAKEK